MATSEVIREATSPEDFAAFVRLVGDFIDWYRDRWSDMRGLVDAFFGYEEQAKGTADLSGAFTPPNGIALLAIDGEAVVGCVAFRRLNETSCELKRVFVSAQHQRRGTGRKLCQAIIAKARAQAYKLMWLETDFRAPEAIGLYLSLGFVDCPAPANYPAEFLPYAVFMELRLAPPPG
jgi:GNAT superfamily N-acetyltransferase